jgi:hypothetical protein
MTAIGCFWLETDEYCSKRLLSAPAAVIIGFAYFVEAAKLSDAA